MVNKNKLMIISTILAIIIVIFLLIILFVNPKTDLNKENNTDEFDIVDLTVGPQITNTEIADGENNRQFVETFRNASMTLSASNTDIKLNQTATFDILINTGTHEIVGVDAIIIYDPKLVQIELLEQSPDFDMYPGKKITNNEVYLSGLLDIGTTKSGDLKLGSVYFKPLSEGDVKFEIKYKFRETIDSNIVESQNSFDVLGTVNNIIFNVQK